MNISSWKKKYTVGTPLHPPYTIQVKAVLGQTLPGDIALDDVWIDDEPCPDKGTLSKKNSRFRK